MTNELKKMASSNVKPDKQAMMEGYLQMAAINMNIVNESFQAESEAESNNYKFITQ